MRRKKRSVSKTLFLDALTYIFGKLFYIAGLTLLFPFIYLRSVEGFNQAQNYLISAILLIVLSVFIILHKKKSLSKTLFVLGTMTLIPGILAILFNFYGSEILLQFIPGGQNVAPIINYYVENILPQFWALTIFYVVIGALMTYFSALLKKQRWRS